MDVRARVLLAVVIGLVPVTASQAATEQKARVLDRTLTCANEIQGGIYELNVYGKAGVRLQGQPSKWKELPTARIGPGNPSSAGFAGLTAGRRDPSVPVYSGMFYDAQRCKRTSRRVPLTPKGLGGQEAGQFEERFECPAGRQLLIRVRAEFARPTDWDSISRFGQIVAGGPALKRGQLAAMTPAGKVLAYVDVNELGRTIIFLRRGNCFPA
jgi:hypothetical protein